MIVLARNDDDEYTVVLCEGVLKPYLDGTNAARPSVSTELNDKVFGEFAESIRKNGQCGIEYNPKNRIDAAFSSSDPDEGERATLVISEAGLAGKILEVKKVTDPRTDVTAWVAKVVTCGPHGEAFHNLLETGSGIIGLGHRLIVGCDKGTVDRITIITFDVVTIREPEHKRALVFSKYGEEAITRGYGPTFGEIIPAGFWDE